MFSTTDNLGLYRLSLGLAEARMDVREFREQMIPALAIETVCWCGINGTRQKENVLVPLLHEG